MFSHNEILIWCFGYGFGGLEAYIDAYELWHSLKAETYGLQDKSSGVT